MGLAFAVILNVVKDPRIERMLMVDGAYVYILSNSFRKLYIGMTTDLMTRLSQHKNKKNPDCHTAKYGIDELVYYERFALVVAAIRREKVLKGWLRVRKLELIISTNPTWRDLSLEWGQPTSPMLQVRPPETFVAAQNAGVLHFVQDDGEKPATATSFPNDSRKNCSG